MHGNTDVVGVLLRPTGQTVADRDGTMVPELESADGYHVNIRLWPGEALNPALEPYVIEAPAHPKRVWA